MPDLWTPRNIRVLLVEDNEPVLKYLQESLGPLFTVEAVRSLAAALERCRQFPRIDAVVLDLGLPNGQGVATIRAVRVVFPAIPLIIITGADITSEEALEAGGDRFFRKPDIAPKKIYDAVVDSIAQRKAGLITKSAEAAVAALKEDDRATRQIIEAKVKQEASKVG